MVSSQVTGSIYTSYAFSLDVKNTIQIDQMYFFKVCLQCPPQGKDDRFLSVS